MLNLFQWEINSIGQCMTFKTPPGYVKLIIKNNQMLIYNEKITHS